jgi:hypothetical protein
MQSFFVDPTYHIFEVDERVVDGNYFHLGMIHCSPQYKAANATKAEIIKRRDLARISLLQQGRWILQ